MLILRPVCEIMTPLKVYLVCNYYNGKVKAPHIIWFMFRWLMTKKKYKGASDAPPTEIGLMNLNKLNKVESIEPRASRAHYCLLELKIFKLLYQMKFPVHTNSPGLKIFKSI